MLAFYPSVTNADQLDTLKWYYMVYHGHMSNAIIVDIACRRFPHLLMKKVYGKIVLILFPLTSTNKEQLPHCSRQLHFLIIDFSLSA